MPAPSRRLFLTMMGIAASSRPFAASAASDARHAGFVRAAFDMRLQAIATGDQPFGAVIVRDGEIVGHGPSRVILKKDANAHAEREAIRDAQARLARTDLSDCVMYSTSRPCMDCQRAAAKARIARMFTGSAAEDLGAPYD